MAAEEKPMRTLTCINIILCECRQYASNRPEATLCSGDAVMFLIVAFIMALDGGMMAYRATTDYRTEIPGHSAQEQTIQDKSVQPQQQHQQPQK